MSEENPEEVVVPGPLNEEAPAISKPKRTTTRRPRGRPKKEEESAGAEEKTIAEKPADEVPPQKELLFSSSDDDDDDSKKASEPSDSVQASSEGDEQKEGESASEGGDNGEQPKKDYKKKGNPNQQRGGRQQKGQQQMSNRKKKQQQWKQKQQQKKGKKDRFKIDGLNADLDTQLELGKLTEWEYLENEEKLKEYLETLPASEGDAFNFNSIYNLPLDQLREQITASGAEMPQAQNRKQLLETALRHANEGKVAIEITGILEVLADGHGMLTYAFDNYRLRAMSAFVPSFLIKKWTLQRGHEIKVRVLPPMEEASCPLAVEILEVQGMAPEKVNEIIPFTEQIPYYPLERIFLESDEQEDANKVSMRVVDLISPIGFGQRGLIVAPPRTGKTVLMQGMAHSIQKNYPDAHLIILLVDERPEEVTDFKRRVSGGEVISSTFDENAESHVHAAEMVIEKSRRLVETGEDVVILLDSITRLARAYNTVMPNSGKILSGGVEANALQKPKRFFGSARNIEGGGSLTIIATALVETGSKMDEVIFEEFKGTGNMELHLDRALVDKRVFPALSMEKSGTRKEELLYHPDELSKIYGLRRAMKGVPSAEAMEMLITKVKKTGSNAEFLMTAQR